MKVTLQVNGEPRTADVDEDTPLLWVLRESWGLTGTKFGCGIGACGACTVHVDGQPARACSVTAVSVQGRAITTIEGIQGDPARAVQQTWIDLQVPQCGYCQSGMIMAVVALLARTPRPSDAEIDATVTNLCRCGTYERVRKAVHAVAARTVVSAVAERASG